MFEMTGFYYYLGCLWIAISLLYLIFRGLRYTLSLFPGSGTGMREFIALLTCGYLEDD